MDPALITPGIARTFSASALTKATRRSKSLYRNGGVSKVSRFSLRMPRSGLAQVLKRLQKRGRRG
jgi:hypothetical protein